MSPFAKHGIAYLSPSSLNLWADSPGLWTLRYLAKVRDETSPAAERGKAVEKGFEILLRGRPVKEAITLAANGYRQALMGETSDEIEDQGALIPPMIEQCAKFLERVAKTNPLEPLAAVQLKVETYLDGVSVPIIGYCDFTFLEGADVDLKTTLRMPQSPGRPDHLRQIALYHRARGRPGALLYVTNKRNEFYEPSIEELRGALDHLTEAAQSLERFLTAMPDARTAIRCVPVDRSHYQFGPNAKIALEEYLTV